MESLRRDELGTNRSPGQAFHSCDEDGGGWQEAEIAIDVICHLPLGWGRALACMEPTNRYEPKLTQAWQPSLLSGGKWEP